MLEAYWFPPLFLIIKTGDGWNCSQEHRRANLARSYANCNVRSANICRYFSLELGTAFPEDEIKSLV